MVDCYVNHSKTLLNFPMEVNGLALKVPSPHPPPPLCLTPDLLDRITRGLVDGLLWLAGQHIHVGVAG